MRKYLLADIVKAVEDDHNKKIAKIIRDYKVDLVRAEIMLYLVEEYKINEDEAFYLTENWDNEADWKLVMDTAEKLNVGIEDVQDDDVEYVLNGAGSKKESESSIGNIQWVYDRELKAYIVYIALTNNSNPKLEPTDVLYRIEPDLMKEWSESSSMGEFYNINIRSNKSLEDPAISCGCGPNPCEQGQIDQFNTKYNNLP